ncbi:MAG: ADP-ribose pyrophosphatase [Hadesarchaea archaeon]|nr:MAG: ADP-ribose pyrophosphatase [Hadesarchaea archaeon]
MGQAHHDHNGDEQHKGGGTFPQGQKKADTLTQYVFRGRRLSVKLAYLPLPSGKLVFREVVEHPGAVAVLPLLERDKILLLKQYRPAIGKWIYEIPAGTVEKGEDYLECARRELEEETGYKARRMEKLFEMYLAPGYSTEKLHSFLASDLEPSSPRRDLGEEIKVVKVPFEKALKMIESNRIEDAKTIATLLFFFTKKR